MQHNDDEDSSENEWDLLETITSFDCEMWEAGGELSILDCLSPPPVALVDDCSTAPSNVTTPVSLLVESLVQQLCTLLQHDTAKSQELYDSICGKLEQMQLIDGTWKMGEFDLMRLQYRNALHQLVRVAQGPEMLLPAGTEAEGVIWPLPQPVTMEWSRYHKDFEELSFIAGGGFGKVFRARNKLDGIVYAVKKVTIRAKSISKIMSHLSEVKTLASLHHINIVPYKTAWLEPLMDDNTGDHLDLGDVEEDEDDDEEESSMGSLSKKSVTTKTELTEAMSKRDEFSDSIVFQDRTGGGAATSEVWTQSLSSRISCEAEEVQSKAILPYDSNGKRSNRKPFNQLLELQPHLKLNWAVLYIQMSECQLTLRTWLDDRNQAKSFTEFYNHFMASGLERNRSMSSLPTVSVPESPTTEKPEPTHLDVVVDIFGQLINGLYYIHSRDIIHHDIKPSNIFISVDHDSNCIIQLGDFGLACPRDHEKTIVGTPQYAAPEQLRGDCDKKSDIYSLGVILMELLLCFSTEMERIKTVNQAKTNIFPEAVPQPFRNLIRRLLSNNVDERPHSFELPEIFSRLSRTRDPFVEDLQKKLRTQDEEIAELKAQVQRKQDEKDRDKELRRKDKEILELRKKLAALKTQDQKTKKLVQAKHHETRKLKKKLMKHQGAAGGSSADTSTA